MSFVGGTSFGVSGTTGTLFRLLTAKLQTKEQRENQLPERSKGREEEKKKEKKRKDLAPPRRWLGCRFAPF
jgi:hypothetical protein